MESRKQSISAETSQIEGRTIFPSTSKPPETYQPTTYRWVVLASYFIVSFSSGATYAVFIAFSSFLGDIYGISHVFVVLTAFIFNGVYPITSLLIADRFIQRFGTHVALICGVAGMIVCLWVRALINVWVYSIVIASVFGAVFYPLLCNIVSKVAMNWFKPSEHVAANVVGALASHVGSSLGSFYALLFIDTDEKDKDKARSQVLNAVIYMAITYTSAYLVSMLFYRHKPVSPPCAEAVESEKRDDAPVKEQLKALVHNKDFLILLLIYNIVLGIVACLGSNISPFLKTFSVTDTKIAVAAGAAFLVSGLIGSAILSCIMARFRYYRLALIVCVITGTAFYILTFVALSQGATALVIVFPAFMGFFLIPVKGLLMSYCCGVAREISEYVVNGFVLTVFCATSMAAAIGTAIMAGYERESMVITYAIVTSLLMAGCSVLVFLVGGKAKLEESIVLQSRS